MAGSGGGKGTRTVAGYDEDTTTMGVEAARAALRPLDGVSPHTLWFSTVAPAYADKTNATAIHAALRLDPDVGAFDANGSVRSAMGTLHAALSGRGAHLVVSADLRSGLAGGPDESAFGDGAAALVVGDGERRPGDRRAHRRRLGHRGVPRPLAHTGRRPLEGLGGALRGDPLRAARGRRLGTMP